MGLEYALFRRGPLTMAPSQLGIFTTSSPDFNRANIQFHVQPLSLDSFGDPLHRFPAITVSACNLRPTSRGTVRLRSADPLAKPVIAPNYLSTDEDRRVAADAIRVTRRLMKQEALRRFRPEEHIPGPPIDDSEAALTKAAGDIGTTIFHPVGTAKMGLENDPLAVVDQHLRVIGLDGLRVIDASVMPTITSGNTNTPTIMIADKGAQYVLLDAPYKQAPAAVAGARRLRGLLTSRHQLLLRFRLEITGVVAFVQLTGEFAIDAVDHPTALDGWPLADRVDPAPNVPVLFRLKELGSLIEPALCQTCVPRPDGDVGDRVVATSDVFVRFEPPVEHVQLTLRLHGEPVYGIFDPGRRIGVEVAEAPADVRRASRLPEQPRQAFRARLVSGRQEDAELLGEVYQDGT
jgi:GMC oxidoreductase